MSGSSWLTPDEVRAVVFDNVGAFRRGYDENQVDDFLDLVVSSLESLHRVIADQRRELGEAREEALDERDDARVVAEQLVNDARRYALETVRRADVTARQIEDAARLRAHQIVAEAGQDLAASAVVVGSRLANLRDELTEEIRNFYGVIGRFQNESVGHR